MINRFQTVKTAELLAYLAVHSEQPHTREMLAELLWPETDPATGRHRLRMALSSLRRQLEPPCIENGAILRADRFNVQLNPDALTTDVNEFVRALSDAANSPSNRIPALRRAVAVFRAPLLTGFYEDWILQERERLDESLLRTIRELVEALDDAGEWQQAIDYARRAIQVDPVREESHQKLIRLLVEDGQLAAARRQYAALETILDEELGEGPSDATRALIENPGRIRQKGRKHDRPIGAPASYRHFDDKPIENQSRSSYPLPPRFTRFFGREAELAELESLLVEDSPCGQTSRLITLLGPAGVGKTRLSIEAASRIADRIPGGTLFVPLADLADASSIPGAILQAMRIPRSPELTPMEQAVQCIVQPAAPSLLILDNFEHLVESGAGIVRSLLERAPGFRCLVTSRQSLGLEVERIYPLSTLPAPDDSSAIQHIAEAASVQLFVDRAQAVRPDFQLTPHNASHVAALCTRLEGLPLAMELAAARVQVAGPRQMLKLLERRFDFLISRKRDAIDRHRTLWQAIDSSYQLLTPELRRFFACLSVFRGGWTLESAAAVCVGSSDSESTSGDRAIRALTMLEELLRSSLILSDGDGPETRFRMLETLREYAWEQLQEDERLTVAIRHATYFAELAETAEAAIDRAVGKPGSAEWLRRLHDEQDNFLAALRAGDLSASTDMNHSTISAACLQLVSSLWYFWDIRGHWLEGLERLRRAMGNSHESRTLLRARSLEGAGWLAHNLNEDGEARAYFEESLGIARGLGDMRASGWALLGLAELDIKRREFNAARSSAEESLSLFVAAQYGQGRAVALYSLARLDQIDDDRAAYRSRLMECLAAARDVGDDWTAASALTLLAMMAIERSEGALAHTMSQEALSIERALGNLSGIVTNLGILAQSHRLLGEPQMEKAAYDEAFAISRQVGDSSVISGSRNGLIHLLGHHGHVARASGDYVRAEEFYSKSLLMRVELGDRFAIGQSFEDFAGLAARQSEFERAARLLGAAEAVGESLGKSLPLAVIDEFHVAVKSSRRALAGDRFTFLWNEGRQMSTNQAVDYALGRIDPQL